MKLLATIRSAYKIKKDRNQTQESIAADINMKFIAALILGGASLLLTIVNIVNRYWFMMWTTIILTVGFAVAAFVCKVFSMRRVSAAIMILLTGILFSMYALNGENDGFAILWILLIPLISMNLLGVMMGTLLSAYFQIFLFVIFYTPIRDTLPEVSMYSETFLTRFPLLYLTGFAMSLLLMIQKEHYSQQIENMANIDAMTGLYNRRYYNTMNQQITKNGKLSELTILSIDVNRLKYTNDTFGHEAGDELIVGTTECLNRAFPDAEAIFRTGGDEFMVITFIDPAQVEKQIHKLTVYTDSYKGKYISEIMLSVGKASAKSYPQASFKDLEKAADAAMYEEKAKFYVRHELDRRKR